MHTQFPIQISPRATANVTCICTIGCTNTPNMNHAINYISANYQSTSHSHSLSLSVLLATLNLALIFPPSPRCSSARVTAAVARRGCRASRASSRGRRQYTRFAEGDRVCGGRRVLRYKNYC